MKANPSTIRLDRLPEETRNAILALYRKGNGTGGAAVTPRQLFVTDEVLTRGTLADTSKHEYLNTNAVAFGRVVLKWLNENPSARRLATEYVKRLRLTGEGVKESHQKYGEYPCDFPDCGRVFNAPQGMGTHRRMAHGLPGKRAGVTNVAA